MAPCLAGLLLVAWLLADPRTPDLAGQVYRLWLYERAGFGIYDTHWYGGHDLPGYSLLFGPLASLAGLRALAVASVLASTAFFERTSVGVFGRSRMVLAGTCLFAVAAVGDVWSGRVTFALGVAFAAACAYAVWRRSLPAAALLAAASAAASPVAGALLALAGLTYALAFGSWRVLVALAGPAAVVAVSVRALFPEGGFESYPATSFLATVVVGLLFLAALPRGGDGRLRALRIGGVLYLAVCVACLLVKTPMGSNVERYGVLLAGPLLLCALAVPASELAGAMGAGSGGGRRWPITALRVLALSAIGVWMVWGPWRETAAVAGSPAASASYYAPVERYLAGHGGSLARVEAPLTRGHWEAAFLAEDVPLARGWEKQLEERYDSVLLGHGLNAASYKRWLDEQAVAYVALPDVPPDGSSAAEGRLIEGGLQYLTLVFESEHWRVWAVRDPTPLLAGPARLTALGREGFTVDASAPARLLLRVHYTPYFVVTAGDASVTEAPGGWTYVDAKEAGRIAVAARFSVGRAFG
ncbi:MAG TPA: hypothetical protein VMG80_06525 [Solirubrobacteraceae bacterium]|nr:hypothetical protein [Solirubrobacteraceae bacterium]